MMAITTNLSPEIHKIVIDGQTQDFQMVPQYSSCLRDDLVFFEDKPDKSPMAGELKWTKLQMVNTNIKLRWLQLKENYRKKIIGENYRNEN